MGEQILLIDDDIDLLESLETSLKLTGYSVITASNATQGIELYKKYQPYMTLSDIKMPDMDGYELFESIRKLDPQAKIILITGHEDVEKSIIAKSNGLLDVLTKPLSLHVLLKNIEKNIIVN